MPLEGVDFFSHRFFPPSLSNTVRTPLLYTGGDKPKKITPANYSCTILIKKKIIIIQFEITAEVTPFFVLSGLSVCVCVCVCVCGGGGYILYRPILPHKWGWVK